MSSGSSFEFENAPSPFNGEDAELFLTAGQFAGLSTKFIIGELLMYGAYFVLALMAMYTIVSRPQRSTRAYLLLAALLITFSIASLLCGFDIASLIVFFESIFIDGSSSVQGRFDNYNAWVGRTKVQPVGYWIGSAGDMGLLYVISDILAAWRAMSIWRSGSRTVLLLVQSFLIFSSFALWVTCAITASLRSLSIAQYNGLPEHESGPIVSALLIASSTASVAANLVATGMIGYTAHIYRRDTGQGVLAVKILAMLTESGLLYAVIQIARLIFMATPNSSISFITASCVFQSTTQIVTAMYTPLLILLIHYGYSMTDGTSQVSTTRSHSKPVPNKDWAPKEWRGNRTSVIQFKQPPGKVALDSSADRSFTDSRFDPSADPRFVPSPTSRFDPGPASRFPRSLDSRFPTSPEFSFASGPYHHKDREGMEMDLPGSTEEGFYHHGEEKRRVEGAV